MAEDKESFLEKLNEYFSQLSDSEEVTIPLKEIFPKDFDRNVVQNAFVRLFRIANKYYDDKIDSDRKYKRVSSITIEKSSTGVNLVVVAPDEWTKIVVSKDPNLRGPFYAITEERLYQQLVASINYMARAQLKQQGRKDLIPTLVGNLNSSEIYDGRYKSMVAMMNDAAKRIIEYHKHNSKNKENDSNTSNTNDILHGVYTASKSDARGRGSEEPEPDPDRKERKSEIYEANERYQILEKMNPKCVIALDRIEQDNSVSRSAYTTYVYENPREKQGFLFVFEPFEGNHNTRVTFVPKQQFDSLDIPQNQNKFTHIAEHIMDMSNDKFEDSKYCKTFKHTSIEKFREKLRRIVLGEQVQNPIDETRFKEADQIIFEGKRRVPKSKIRNLALGNKNNKKENNIKGPKITGIIAARGEIYDLYLNRVNPSNLDFLKTI